MPSNSDDTMNAQEQKLRQLQARQERLKARRGALVTQRSRREETRRKILVDALVLAKVECGEIPEDTLKGWLVEALERDEDRALFGLTQER